MKARTFIITGAILTLVAPVAQASVERVLPSKPAITKHQRIVNKQQHRKIVDKVRTGHGNTKQGKTLYIYYPAPAGQPSVAPDYTDQELCENWAMNCDVVSNSATIEVPQATSAAVETPASNTSSTESAPVASSTSDTSSASDANSLLCPGGGVWDDDHQYCA